MPAIEDPAHVVDTHQHIWQVSKRRYDWITPDMVLLNRDYSLGDIAADRDDAGITATVLVQAADSYEDTFAMISAARADPVVKGIVGWVPLDRHEEAAAALAAYVSTGLVKGIRASTHQYSDAAWILRPEVARGIELVGEAGLALDIVTVTNEQAKVIPTLAARYPELPIVVDHMAKPDIATRAWNPWAEIMTASAACQNITVKFSGLNTASNPGWTVADWQPYVDHVVSRFGARRVMMGSDWPVSLVDDLKTVWRAQREAISAFPDSDQEEILFGTAGRVYKLELG